jgi:hypothetical protein
MFERGPLRAALVVGLVLVALLGCGGSTETPSSPPQEKPPPAAPATAAPACPPSHTVATVTDLNYPTEDCAGATAQAQERLDSGHYVRACRAAGVADASAVFAARVTECITTDRRGVFLDIEVCCAPAEEPVAEPETETVIRADGPDCPDWRTPTSVSGLHYPEAEDCEAIIANAESELASAHYRKACEAAVPRSTRPPRVLEASVVECRSGGETPGILVNVELCCEARVFDEPDLRTLVMGRSPDEVRATLGEPLVIEEQPPRTQWSYLFEVARGDEVFDGVTLVFVDGRVDGYFF